MSNLKYYILLNIPTNATHVEIKKAYRKKAHELHPDKNKDADTTKKFQEINHAYKVLSNTQFENSIESNFYATSPFFDDANSNICEADIYSFNTNIDILTCECKDFKEKRYKFPKYDPRRLCRHLIAKFSISAIECHNTFITPYNIYNKNRRLLDCYPIKLNIPIFLEPFRNEIESNYSSWYRLSLSNNIEYIFFKYSIIVISHYEREIKCMLKNREEHIHVNFDGDVMIDYYPCIKSKNFNEIIKYLKKSRSIDILYNLDKAINDSKIEKFKDIDEAWDKGFLLSRAFDTHFIFNIEKNNTIEDNKINIADISNKHKIKFNNYLKSLDKFELGFDTTQNLLKDFNSSFSVMMFNKLLKDMRYLTKVDNVNFNDWILINNGNNYGMNYIRSSMYTHISVPDWYKIKYFDYDSLSLKTEVRYGLQRMTIILWKKTSFRDLLDVVKKHKILYDRRLKEKNTLKEKEKRKNTKKIKVVNVEREAWLKNIICPYCNGKNIHKKDKRQRKDYQVQRYMCMDCKKIFQKVIEEN